MPTEQTIMVVKNMLLQKLLLHKASSLYEWSRELIGGTHFSAVERLRRPEVVLHPLPLVFLLSVEQEHSEHSQLQRKTRIKLQKDRAYFCKTGSEHNVFLPTGLKIKSLKETVYCIPPKHPWFPTQVHLITKSIKNINKNRSKQAVFRFSSSKKCDFKNNKTNLETTSNFFSINFNFTDLFVLILENNSISLQLWTKIKFSLPMQKI